MKEEIKVDNKRLKIVFIIFIQLLIFCGVTNILAARYYRLLEKERKIFLGLRGIDSLAANEYLDLESATERAQFYGNFWMDKKTEERQEFEERVEYAFRKFGRHAPISDDRIPIYVKNGPPSKREEINPQKKIGIKIKEIVKPAEVWTYKKDGNIFDFVRIKSAYKLIAQSEFGEKVEIPHFKEVVSDTEVIIASPRSMEFKVATGRFRQKKNLTRLEIYITIEIEDTINLRILRNIKIFDKEDSLIQTKKSILIPEDKDYGIFFDEINFWLVPDEYRLEIELVDMKNMQIGKKSLDVSLMDYQDDAKEISDLIPAKVIDNAFTHEKFNKPVGRVIPMTEPVIPVHTPFYFYAEVYNLETKNGAHRLKTTYEVYNKEKMRREIVDVMINDHIEAGDVAYLGAEYHPMDLNAGHYIIVMRVKDLLSGKERAAVSEFELISTE
jgi:GWxTD domain-containing protein